LKGFILLFINFLFDINCSVSKVATRKMAGVRYQ
jgi:hypothetical protein